MFEGMSTHATDDLPPILVVEDVAEVLRISVAHARRLVSTGRIPGVRRGRRWYVLRETVLDALRPEEPNPEAAAAEGASQ